MSPRAAPAMVEKFRVLAAERMVRLNQAYLRWQVSPNDKSLVHVMLRELHTLKGEAKMVGVPEVAQMAHRIEDMLARANQPLPDVLRGFDAIGTWLSGSSKPVPEVAPTHQVCGETSSQIALKVAQVQRRRSRRVENQTLDALADATHTLVTSHRQATGLCKRLETALAQAVAASAEGLAPLWELTEALQATLKAQRLTLESLEAKVREVSLVPLATLIDTFERAVHDVAREHGKEARLVQSHTQVGLETDILDGISEPLLHLITNAVVHGIEPPAQRRTRNKTPMGTISVTARQEAAMVEIEVSDDGQGVNLQRVADVALAQDLFPPDGSVPADDALLQLIFRPGFTIRARATHSAGRGMGLDAVQAEIARLGGSLEVRTTLGAGTTFLLRLPTSMTAMRALFVEVPPFTFAVASERATLVAQKIAPGATSVVLLDGNEVPVLDLNSLLGRPQASEPCAWAVVIEHQGRRKAIPVGHFAEERGIVCRRLDPFLSNLPYLAGSISLDDDALAWLLDIPHLLANQTVSHAKPTYGTVLVVDDSPLTRAQLAEVLQSKGFKVEQSPDGLAALNKLVTLTAAAVVTDVDMPHLDGLALTAAIRRNPKWRALPIILMSAKADTVHAERCRTSGANAFLPKDHSLIKKVVAHLETLCVADRPQT